jgi:thiamine biosynthesis lipoprotein
LYRCAIVFFSILYCVSCGDRNHRLIKIQGRAQGTTYTIVYIDSSGNNFSKEIDSLLTAFDNSLSAWNENSIISKVNRNDTSVIADDFFRIVFSRSMEIAAETRGAFDPTVAPLVNAWGFGLKNKSITDSATIDSLRGLVNYSKVLLTNTGKVVKADKRMMLDFNAIAQGYSVDVISVFLEKQRVMNYMVEIGGEVRASGKNQDGKAWRIGIDKPLENQENREMQAVVSLLNRSLATSGNYRKFYEENGIKYSHTIDPATGYPVRHSLLSATVVAPDCMSADAYATAFMVIGLEKTKIFLASHPELDVFLIYSGSAGEILTFSTEGLEKNIKKV